MRFSSRSERSLWELKSVLLTVVVAISLGCGDGGPAASSAPPSQAAAANVSLFASCFGSVRCSFTIRESAGVRANINWVRVYWPDGVVGEIGSSDLINAFGTNVVSGNQMQFEVSVPALRNCCAGFGSPSRFEVNYTDLTGTKTVEGS